jgi:acetoin utilization protein AcuC
MAGETPTQTQNCAARLVWDERYMQYDFGPQHPLRPERFTYGLDLLKDAGLWQPERETLRPEPAARGELELVHSPDYVEIVERLDSGAAVEPMLVTRHGLGPGDNPSFPHIHESSSLVASGTLQAARGVMAGEFLHAFNPAGGLHHAMRDRASGFCVYNDVALAIAALVQEHGARVLYLDFDAHHGDGVQALFYGDPRVLTFSIHESGRYLFPGTGGIEELGEGAGRGYAVNVPMEPFTQDDSWLAAVNRLVPELAERFEPDFIVSQHGCDGHAWDPLTHLAITTRAIAEQARLVHELAHRHCGGRWIGSGGGGYDFRRVVPRMYALVFSQMADRPLSPDVPATWRERWASSGSEPLPITFEDPPEEFPPAPRAEEIVRRNAETVERVRQSVLPGLRQGRWA